MKLTLVTLNTWKGEGDYPARLSAMGDLLEELNPDLVFLQEVLAIPGTDIDTAKILAERLGCRAVSHPARNKPRRIDGEVYHSTSGLALLSRLELRSAQSVSLPTDPADGERIAQIVECDIGDAGMPPLIAVNLHLSHLPDATSCASPSSQPLTIRRVMDRGRLPCSREISTMIRTIGGFQKPSATLRRGCGTGGMIRVWQSGRLPSLGCPRTTPGGASITFCARLERRNSSISAIMVMHRSAIISRCGRSWKSGQRADASAAGNR